MKNIASRTGQQRRLLLLAMLVVATACEGVGLEEAHRQARANGYEVSTCSTHDPALRPSWCAWSDAPPEAERLPASDHDDSWNALNDTGVAIRFFSVDVLQRGRRTALHPTSNGFLSPTPFLACQWYCPSYTYPGPASLAAAPSWPMVALYNTDLDPSVGAGPGRRGLYLHRSPDSSEEWMTEGHTPHRDARHATVWFYEVPLFGSSAPALPNFTGSVTAFANGTVIMRFRRLPPPSNPPAIVGLFFSQRQFINVPPPVYHNEPPRSADEPGAHPHDSATADLSVYAYRFDLVAGACREFTTCAACIASGSCAWCAGGGGGDMEAAAGVCWGADVVDDGCDLATRFTGQCSAADLITSPLPQRVGGISQLQADSVGFYNATVEDADSTIPAFSSLTARYNGGHNPPIALPFSVPIFYYPREGRSSDHPRWFSHFMISTHGLVQLSRPGQPEQAHIAPLHTPRMTPLVSIGYAILPQRPRTNAVCHSSGSTCVPSLYVRFANMTITPPHNVKQLFDVAVAVHADGSVQLWHAEATTSDSIRTRSSTTTTHASLFANDPPFFIGISMRDETGTTRTLSIPWTRLGAHQRWRLHPLRSCTACLGGGRCDHRNATCVCAVDSHLVGAECSICRVGWFRVGSGVSLRCAQCPACVNGGVCDGASGECVCPTPFWGPRCELRCQDTATNRTCELCNATNGQCVCGTCVCHTGFTGETCAVSITPAPTPLPSFSVAAGLWNFFGIAFLLSLIIASVPVAFVRWWLQRSDAAQQTSGVELDSGGDQHHHQPLLPNPQLMTPLNPLLAVRLGADPALLLPLPSVGAGTDSSDQSSTESCSDGEGDRQWEQPRRGFEGGSSGELDLANDSALL